MIRPSRVRRPLAAALGLVLLVGASGCSHAPEPTPAPAARSTDTPSAPADGIATGLASYYATKFEGRKTASGDVYHRDRYTAAHRTLPFGTRIRVTRVATGKSVELVVNDRGPFRKGRIVDVSRRAAEDLDLVKVGVARVTLEVLEDDDR